MSQWRYRLGVVLDDDVPVLVLVVDLAVVAIAMPFVVVAFAYSSIVDIPLVVMVE